MKPLYWNGGAILLALASIAASYGFALLGEPRSHWAWCEMLRLCE